MTKKFFGKRFVAMLTTLAILISMVAMIGSFAVSADTSPYTPKRVFSVTGSGEQVNAKLALNNATIGLTDGEKATIKGYYKIENYVALNSTDSALWLGGGSDAKLIVTGNTDGWVPLELTCTVGSGWIYFEHWYSQGTLSLADIVVEDASGKKYEMATDATATAGDYTVGYSAGSWYGGNYLDKDTAAFHFDPVYVEPYAPKRVMSIVAPATDANTQMKIIKSGTVVGEGKEVTLSGYYKIENYAVVNAAATPAPGMYIGSVDANGILVTDNTDGWVYFEKAYTTGDSNWFGFEFWYASGKLSLADIKMTDAEGNVVYNMATDADLTAGEVVEPFGTTLGMWYFRYYSVKEGCVLNVDPAVPAGEGEGGSGNEGGEGGSGNEGGEEEEVVYVPKRVFSATGANSEVNAKMAFNLAALGLANGKKVTIKGMYKVDNFVLLNQDAGSAIYVGTGSAERIVVKDNTDGWVPFELEATIGSSYIYFEHFYTQGTLSIADIIVEDEDGNKYDMARDASVPKSAHTGGYDDGKWWTGFYNKAEDASFSFDEAYPTRVLIATGEKSEVNAKMAVNLLALGLTNGKKVTITGKYKVENFKLLNQNEGSAVYIGTGTDARIVVKDNTDGWVEFELTATVGNTYVYFEHFYTQGTISIADLVFEDEDGKKYELVSDTSLPEQDHTGHYDDGRWYTGFYNNASHASYHFDPAVIPASGEVTPPPEVPVIAVPTPQIPNMLEKDSSGYAPNRAFGIINRKDALAKAEYMVWAEDYFLDSDKYYIFANVKVSGFEAFADATDAACQIDMLAGESTVVLGKWTADTDGWVALKNADGTPISFDKLTAEDSFVLTFGVKNAAADFIVADLIIADAEGNIVYSLANDKTLNAPADMRYVALPWKATPFVANAEGPALFPIQTKGNADYVPNVGISVAPEAFNKTAENSIIIMTNAAPFEAGKTYTIHGKMAVVIQGGFMGNANPKFDFTSHTLGPIGSMNACDTSGWVSLVYPNGDPITFKGTADLDYVKFNLYNTYGVLALADIFITDSEGNVVYDMAKDETLIGQAGSFEAEGFVDKGDIWRIVLGGYGAGTIYVNGEPVTHTADDYKVPTFVETVEVPEIEEEPSEPSEPTPVPPAGDNTMLGVLVALMAVSALAIVTLKKKEF